MDHSFSCGHTSDPSRSMPVLVCMNPRSDGDVFARCRRLNYRSVLPVGLWRDMRFRLHEKCLSDPHQPKRVAL